MKSVWLTLAMLLCQMPDGLAAEYRGKIIDGRTFPAQVYSYETGGVYDARVQFNGNQVTITFPGGGQFLARLQQSTIRDPTKIEVFGRPGTIPLGNSFSIGFNYGSARDNLFPNSPNSLGSFWRISINDAQFNREEPNSVILNEVIVP